MMPKDKQQEISKAPDTSYPRISANKLLALSIEEMEKVLAGYFYLVFDDGEVLTSARPTIYSAYGWRLVKTFPKLKLSVRHHLSHYYPIDPTLHSQSKLVNGGAQTMILGEIVNDWFDAYPDYQDDEKIALMHHFFDAVNALYNELQLKAEAYVGSISVTDLVDLINHPKLRACRDGIKITPRSVVDIQRNMINIMKNDPELSHNQIIRFLRAGLTKESQLVQCIGPWGYPRDIDEYVFPYAIERGYGEGIRSFRDSLMESRTASRALHLAGPALQNTEYFSRRATISGMQVERLHRGDCGSQIYHYWTVDGEADLAGHEGVWYLDPATNQLKDIKRSDKHLIGRTLKIRSIEGCIHPDPNGVCEVCYGKLSRNVFKRTNIGSQSTTTTTSNNSQKILSNKHEVKTAVVDDIILDDLKATFFKVMGGNGYGLKDDRKAEGVINKLLIKKSVMVNITDVLDDVGLKNISPSRVTKISGIKFITNRKDPEGNIIPEQEIDIAMDMSFQHRYAYMTRDLLQYIKEHGWGFNRSGDYIIDLKDWDTDKILMKVPEQVFSTMDFSKDLENMLEGSSKARDERSEYTIPTFIDGFYELATKKLDVNWSALQTMAYAATVVDNLKQDASLPKPWTKGSPGIKKDTMFQRSMSVSMAFEGHKVFLTDPDNFLHTNRPDHVMDWMFLPQEVSKYPRQY
jgi:hypothetical protein